MYLGNMAQYGFYKILEGSFSDIIYNKIYVNINFIKISYFCVENSFLLDRV